MSRDINHKIIEIVKEVYPKKFIRVDYKPLDTNQNKDYENILIVSVRDIRDDDLI